MDSHAAAAVPSSSQSPRTGLSREVSRRAPRRLHPEAVVLCSGDGAVGGASHVWAVAGHPVAPGLGRHAKPPLAGPQQVVAYLGRYTHRIAIGNERLVAENDMVYFAGAITGKAILSR